MIIKFFDKDGKCHKMNLGKNAQLYIGVNVGDTDEIAEIKVEECHIYNKAAQRYESNGCMSVSPSSAAAVPLAVMPNHHSGEIVIGSPKHLQ
jgi:hypothetical protein